MLTSREARGHLRESPGWRAAPRPSVTRPLPPLTASCSPLASALPPSYSRSSVVYQFKCNSTLQFNSIFYASVTVSLSFLIKCVRKMHLTMGKVLWCSAFSLRARQRRCVPFCAVARRRGRTGCKLEYWKTGWKNQGWYLGETILFLYGILQSSFIWFNQSKI